MYKLKCIPCLTFAFCNKYCEWLWGSLGRLFVYHPAMDVGGSQRVINRYYNILCDVGVQWISTVLYMPLGLLYLHVR